MPRQDYIQQLQRAEHRRRLLDGFQAQLERDREERKRRESIVTRARRDPDFQLDDEIDLRLQLELPCYCGKAKPDHDGDCAR